MRQQLSDLRAAMQAGGIDYYVVTSEDDHMSEYPATHFYSKKFFSGFTGSAGSLLISQDHAGLWVDGRYYVQARKQLVGTGFVLHESTHSNLQHICDYLKENAKEGQTVAMDTSTISFVNGKVFNDMLTAKGCKFINHDFAAELWADRPALPGKPVWNLGLEYAGKSAADKLSDIREKMAEKKAQMHVLSSLDDIAWVCNLRSSDVLHTPVFYSYMLIDMENAYLYSTEAAFPEDVLSVLSVSGITLRSYDAFLSDAEKLTDGKSVLLSSVRTSYALYNALSGAKIIDGADPSTLMKSVKNDVEIANLRQANIKDGAAMAKFIYWVKSNIGVKEFSEMDASDYIDDCRRERGAFDLSFTTIAAYGSNAAMCHYSPTADDFAMVEPKGFLLVDSGGDYLEGTTDITRTIVVGPLTDEERRSFTLVLKGMIDLAMAKFPEGTSGRLLDSIARMPLWKAGYDFNHGTGHGIGYALSVHEGPQNISPRASSGQAFLPGMVTSDEPGIYVEGGYGIRHEIDVLCVKDVSNDFGSFLGFETLTLCPFDRDAIIKDMLTAEELDWLNAYHRTVYEKISPEVSDEVAAWLKEATAKI